MSVTAQRCRPAHAKSDSLEHPLKPCARSEKELTSLARALLYADQTLEAHLKVLQTAFEKEPSAARVKALANRTVLWASAQPQPRLRALVRQLRTDPLLGKLAERSVLKQLPLISMPARMRPLSGAASQLKLETIRELADWLRVEPEHVLWYADLHDRNRRAKSPLLGHYTSRIIAKPYSSIRLLEIPKRQLRSIQRRILDEILSAVPLHSAVHGFRKGRSILSFAAPHVAREAVLRVDLKDFFPSISGSRVQALFRTLGYPEQVSDLLGGLCTTTTPGAVWRNTNCELSAAELQRARVFYARPHLPQGAPTSPAISNLCAFRLDRRLSGLADRCGAAYTRYADDLAFSGDLGFARAARRFSSEVEAIALEEGFSVHQRKTRLMRPSVRQHLAGITLNVRSGIRRRELERLEAILTNCIRYGPQTQNRQEHPDFRRHLQGKVAFVGMVNPAQAVYFRTLLSQISWPNGAESA